MFNWGIIYLFGCVDRGWENDENYVILKIYYIIYI